jgi:hypothetical protein
MNTLEMGRAHRVRCFAPGRPLQGPPPARHGSSAQALARLGIRLAAAALVAAGNALPTEAQVPELPTLRDLGVEYVSASGLVQLTLSGQLDLEGLHATAGAPTAAPGLDGCQACHVEVARAFMNGEGAFTAARLRLFVDFFLGDHVYTMAEVRTSRGRESLIGGYRTNVEQLFVRFIDAGARVALQAGRFASPFGSYTARHRSVVDPFVSAPLMYDYRTVMNRWRAPGSASAFLTWQDRPEDPDLPGTPPIWETPYQWGAMATSTVGPLELRLAAMNSSPSSQPNAWKQNWDRFRPPSWVVGARWQASPSLALDASWNRGPWLEGRNAGANAPPPDPPPPLLEPGWRSFDQEMASASVAWARGPYMVRLEGLLDYWSVPNITSRASERGVNIEVQRDLGPGLSAALRYGHLDFRPLDDGLGDVSPWPGGRDWDRDVSRYEGSLAYRLTEKSGLLLSGYQQVQQDASDGDGTFAALRLWWSF